MPSWAGALDHAALQELGRLADAQLRTSVRALLDAEQLKRHDARSPGPGARDTVLHTDLAVIRTIAREQDQ